MKIIGTSPFIYPTEAIGKWRNQPFQPYRDTKFRIRLDDLATIEAATFERKGGGKNDTHACISTQAGCKFGCLFCQSGRKGFQRNLSCGEIMEEIGLLAKNISVKAFDHLVYMGIGEPLDNFDQVAASIDRLNKDYGYAGKISLATVGVPANLIRLGKAGLQLDMAWISLHAATNEKRALIMPVAKKHHIKDVISASRSFAAVSGTKTWLNYMLLRGFNDSKEDALALKNLLAGTENQLAVFLTVPNGTIPGYEPGGFPDILNFESLLVGSGLKNRVFKTIALGRDVEAGCGEFIFNPAKS
jgi:23S rRNA (adenine2503-C2)-methyltransferase